MREGIKVIINRIPYYKNLKQLQDNEECGNWDPKILDNYEHT